MYLIPIAWLYVTMMMAVAEATNSNGTVLGAIVTFVLYGLLPVVLVVYLMRTPARRKAIRAREAEPAIPVEEKASLRSGLSPSIPVEDRASLRSGLSPSFPVEDRASLRSGLSPSIPVEDRASLRSGLSPDVSGDPDTGRHTAAAAQGDAVAPVREEK